MKPSLKKLQADVVKFNMHSGAGSWVNYREIMPEGKDEGTPPKAYKVQSEAYVHEGHTAAVFLDGVCGFVCVTHCRPVKWVVDDIHATPQTRFAGPFITPGEAVDARKELEKDPDHVDRNFHIIPVEWPPKKSEPEPEPVKPKPPETPELEKLSAARPQSEPQGSFIEWLREKGLILCRYMEWEDAPDGYHPATDPIERLLAEYHGIDLDKCEQERRALLEYMRELNEPKG